MNGYPYSNPLPANIRSACTFVNENKENCAIIIDGASGRGKTTLAVHLTDQINQEFGQDILDLSNPDQLGMGMVQFQKKLGICQQKGLHALIYDEAGDYNKKGAMGRLNKLLNKTWETFRVFRIIPILCLPRFYKLDSPIFDNEIPKLLIHCKEKHENSVDFAAYDFAGMEWMLYHMKKNKLLGRLVYNKTEPIFMGHFLRLDNDRERKLEILTMEGKKDINKQIRIETEGLVNVKDIVHKVGRSDKWVRGKIKELGFREKDIIEGAYYYEGRIIDVLIKQKRYKK